MLRILILLLSVFALNITQAQTNYIGDIPPSRLSASKWQYFTWDDSGTWETIDVTQHGIIPGSTEDIAPKVEAIIQNGSGKRILKFLAGTYYIKSQLNISKSDIQIVGVGSATKFMLQGGSNPASIIARGSQSGNYRLSADASRGDSIVTLTSSSGLNVGDYINFEQKGSFTRPGPGVSGKEVQMFKIIAKTGNTLALDMNFGIPFLKGQAEIVKINAKKNLRFHNFYIEMTSMPTGLDGQYWHNISVSKVQNVEFSNIESKKALHTHIELSWSKDVIFFQNNLYGNFGFDKSGGYQYGIKLNWCTQCYVINNRTSDLRHHYATQFGTNHCVIAYNRAEPPYNHYGDFGQHNSKGCHNNLWEGNYGSEIYDDINPKKSWGTRYTMWFRNHATSKIGSENAYVEHMTIIGNELEGGADAIKKGAPGEDVFSGANILNVTKEKEDGTVLWGDMKDGAAIPASLFLTKKPSYLSKWPLFGPPASQPVTYLFDFIKLKNKDEINKGSNLLVEASVDIAFTEVSLYVNDKLLSTLTEAPYKWVSFPQLMNMMAPTYSLKLVGKLTDGEYLEKKITITTPVQWAYTQNVIPHPVPGIIHAEAYDYGGENIAHYDRSEQGASYSYRGTDKVDLGSGGTWLKYIESNEWLEYSVDVKRSGTYNLAVKHETRRSPEFEAISFSFSESNKALFSQLVCTNTGSGVSTIDTFKSAYLERGKYILRLDMLTYGYDLDYFEFILTSQPIDYGNVGTLANPANPESYDNGDVIQHLEAPLDSLGFGFSGWYTNETFTDSLTIPAIAEGDKEPKIFYAKWTPQPLVGSALVYGDIVEGQTLRIDTSLIGNNSGRLIYQWQRAVGNSFADIAGAINHSYSLQNNDIGTRLRVKISSSLQTGEMMSSITNSILTVTDDKYTITYNSNGGIDGNLTQEITGAGGSPTFIAHPVREGYTLSHWANEQGDTLNPESLINSDTTLYAQWKVKIRYTVYFEMDDDTTEVLSDHYPAYLSHLPNAPLKADSVLSHWRTEQGEPFDTTFLLEKDLHVYPIWQVKRFGVNVVSIHGGIIYEPQQSMYEIHSGLTLTAVPSNAYEFVNWTGDYASNNTNITIVVDSTINLIANYRSLPTYKLEVFSTNASFGSVTKYPNVSRHISGTSVDVTAVPSNGYVFKNWIGDYSGTENPLTIDISENMELFAAFDRATGLNTTTIENLTVSPNPNNGGFLLQLGENANANYKLYTLSGMEVMGGNFITETKIQIDSSKPGVFLLDVSTENKRAIQKIIIK